MASASNKLITNETQWAKGFLKIQHKLHGIPNKECTIACTSFMGRNVKDIAWKLKKPSNPS